MTDFDDDAVLASYKSFGDAQLDHETGLIVDYGKLPDGRRIKVWYDRTGLGDDEWPLSAVTQYRIDEDEDD